MDLYTILREAHSGWRYLVFLLLAAVIVKYVIGWLQKGQWTGLDRRLGLFTTITVDIQLVLGLIVWGMLPMQPYYDQLEAGFRRIQMMEHPAIMLVAIAVMHVGWVLGRKAPVDATKFRNGALTFIVTGLLIAVGVALITGFM